MASCVVGLPSAMFNTLTMYNLAEEKVSCLKKVCCVNILVWQWSCCNLSPLCRNLCWQLWLKHCETLHHQDCIPCLENQAPDRRACVFVADADHGSHNCVQHMRDLIHMWDCFCIRASRSKRLYRAVVSSGCIVQGQALVMLYQPSPLYSTKRVRNSPASPQKIITPHPAMHVTTANEHPLTDTISDRPS